MCQSLNPFAGAVNSTGSLSAQINGISWAATCVPPAENGAKVGYISVAGTDGSRQMLFQVRAGGVRDLLGTVPLTVGTYQIGGPARAYGGDSYVNWANVCSQPPRGPCPVWTAQEGLGAGAVAITNGSFSVTF